MVMSSESTDKRGKLKVYLGYAPGVGKTYTMLSEARRMRERGRDVEIGYFEPHGRTDTMKQLEGLPRIPMLRVEYGGSCFYEMDTDAIISRHPGTVLVDELAHTNKPGMKHKKRYEDVMEILEHGINVHTTVNLQHLESMNEIVRRITGVESAETIPDRVLDEADEVVVIDIQPSSLINRVKRGAVYQKDEIDRALSHFFKLRNLNTLRELALRRVADHVDSDISEVEREAEPGSYWHTTERLLVAITAEEKSQHLIRVAAQLNQRLRGEFYVAHVACSHWLAEKETDVSRELLRRNFALAKELGAECVELAGKSVSAELLKFADEKEITKIVLGHTRRSRTIQMFRGSTINKCINHSDEIQVIITPMEAY